MTANAFDGIVRVDSRESVCWVMVDGRDGRNGLSLALSRGLADQLKAIRHDAAVRCVVLRGADDTFCAADDLHLARPTDRSELVSSNSALVRSLRDLTVPTIAALNGPAAGIGAAIALACDLRYAVPRASLTFDLVRSGLPATGGTSWMLPRLIGPARALELLYTGRALTAAEATALGIVNRVVPADGLEKEVGYVATVLAHMPGSALSAIKRQVRFAEGADFDEASEFETYLFSALSSKREA